MSITGKVAELIYAIRTEAAASASSGVERESDWELPEGLSVVLGKREINTLERDSCPQYLLGKAMGKDELLGLPIVRVDDETCLRVEVRQPNPVVTPVV
ncbi:hypothetical protein NHF39_28075 [Pseudomonas proteolytica]|nr:hypothetical protein [Pseudomonas proteolytica]USW94971.1 hypothetical protein NHF39_28075 [Pseudomonas proteolytica]USX00996.1 hypothetical protein NHF41_03600 [Pseudomonas proteolytica]